MEMYTLNKVIDVEASPDTVWAFISHPRNLDRITPDDMAFEIVSDVPEVMHNGLLVEYRVRIPWLGWRSWVSELKHIVPGRSFVDEQKIGPYRFWYHEHRVESAGEGSRIVDRVSYEVPFGFFGRMLHPFIIQPTLKRIFRHRERMLCDLLGKA
jgi:ligand-binding SRPBCC domain-containing protein